MAKMRTLLKDCISEGERKVWRFINDYFSDDYWVWMNCKLMRETPKGFEANEIDLIIYGPEIGILVFSIKDWRIDQLREITKNRVVLANGTIKGHPYLNAEQHRYCIQSKLKKKEFLDELGRPQVSVNAGVVFPFIKKDEFSNLLKKWKITDTSEIYISLNAFLFSEEFSAESYLINPLQRVVRLKNVRDKRYTWVTPLSQEQLDYLDELLAMPQEEEELIDEITKDGAFTRVDNSIILKLDEKQKELAYKYLSKIMQKPGHSLIKGVAGSGKTILLQYLFLELAKVPDYKILFVVYNNALVNSIKENLKELGIPIEHPNYEITTFHKLVYRLFPSDCRRLDKGQRGHSTDSAIADLCKRKINQIKGEYDFVLIDEGQDFMDEWIKFLVGLSKEEGNVVYSEDFEQNLYGRKRAYIDAGLDVKGQGKESSSLLINYRNTKQINLFALKKSRKFKEGDEERTSILRDGPEPIVLKFSKDKKDKCAESILKQIEDWENIGYQPESIALIYTNYFSNSVIDKVCKAYARNNKKINFLSPKGFVPTPFYRGPLCMIGKVNLPGINKLTTLHSSKGLDFDCVVFVHEYQGYTKRNHDEEMVYNSLYIGCTRARSELVLVTPDY